MKRAILACMLPGEKATEFTSSKDVFLAETPIGLFAILISLAEGGISRDRDAFSGNAGKIAHHKTAIKPEGLMPCLLMRYDHEDQVRVIQPRFFAVYLIGQDTGCQAMNEMEGCSLILLETNGAFANGKLCW